MNKSYGITNDLIDQVMPHTTKIRKKPPSSHSDAANGGPVAPPASRSEGVECDSRENWERPIPLTESSPPDEFNLNDLEPPEFREMVGAVAASFEIPLAFALLTGLGVLAGAATYGTDGAAIHVRDDWWECTTLYTLTALESGNRKTGTFGALCAPVRAFEKSLAAQMRSEIAAAKSKRRANEKRLAELESGKALSGEEEEERVRLAGILAQSDTPDVPRLVTDDVTSESLVRLMAAHAGKIMLVAPEPDIFGMMQGRYTQRGHASLSVFLQGFGGEPLCIDRVGSGTVRVERPLLTAVVSAQPTAISQIVTDPVLAGRGLLNRFLYAVPRDSLGRRRGNSPAIPEDVRARYERLLGDILKRGSGRYDPEAPIRVLRFSAEAVRLIDEFWRENEASLDESGALADLKGWGAKLPGAVCRIAAIMEIACNVHAEEVSADRVRKAIGIGRVLRSHAVAVFSGSGTNPDVKRAMRLLAWIQRKGELVFTRRDAHQALRGSGHALIRKGADLDGAFSLLVEHQFIDRVDERGRQYVVNPYTFEPESQK
jgi:replicative DNA helicase